MRRLAVALPCLIAAAGCGASPHRAAQVRSTVTSTTATSTTATTSVQTTRTTAAAPRPRPRPPFGVGLRVVTFVDHSRQIHVPGMAPEPRTLVTLIRYPTGAKGPFPLVVFGHGFNETPAPYADLLQAWARAGYVVAAPVFPLENANAPGGPNENDLFNQPQDMSFLISSLLARNQSNSGFLGGLINPRAIAVAGQSDGGETALTVAYNRCCHDARVGAAVILSGAKIPGQGGYDFARPTPPLLATQGTADTINPPSFTTAFYDVAPRPKYLLTMFGASHLPPYTDEQPQLGVVERVAIAFLNYYLKGEGSPGQIKDAGDISGISTVDGGP